MKSPKVSIIILNWNGWKDTIECLESLYRISYPNYEVIIVDNGSANESVQKIKDWADGKEKISSKFFDYDPKNKPIKYYEYTKKELEEGKYLTKKKKLDKLPSDKKLFILKNDQNYGFAEGNNIAMRQVLKEKQSEYILLLNNDTVVKIDFLTELSSKLKLDHSVGIVGSNSYNYYNGEIDFGGGRVNWWLGRPYAIKHEVNTYTDFITGCSMLIRLSHLANVGLFDKSYFCYFEDADLCERFKKNKFNLSIAHKSVVMHKISKSSKRNGIYHYYFSRNRLMFNKRFNNNFITYYFFKIFQKYIKRIAAKLILKKEDYSYWLKGLKDSS
jgi:GT2 family glycosyltransferase